MERLVRRQVFNNRFRPQSLPVIRLNPVPTVLSSVSLWLRVRKNICFQLVRKHSDSCALTRFPFCRGQAQPDLFGQLALTFVERREDLQLGESSAGDRVNQYRSLSSAMSSAPERGNVPSGKMSCWRASKSGIRHEPDPEGGTGSSLRIGLERFVTTTVSPASTHFTSVLVSLRSCRNVAVFIGPQ